MDRNTSIPAAVVLHRGTPKTVNERRNNRTHHTVHTGTNLRNVNQARAERDTATCVLWRGDPADYRHRAKKIGREAAGVDNTPRCRACWEHQEATSGTMADLFGRVSGRPAANRVTRV